MEAPSASLTRKALGSNRCDQGGLEGRWGKTAHICNTRKTPGPRPCANRRASRGGTVPNSGEDLRQRATVPISTEEPLASLDVVGGNTEFLLGTEAACSLPTQFSGPVSSQTRLTALKAKVYTSMEAD